MYIEKGSMEFHLMSFDGCVFLECFVVGFVAFVSLMSIKSLLIYQHKVMENWNINYVDPCSWSMVCCSTDNSVTALFDLLIQTGFLSVIWFSLNITASSID